MLVVSPDPALMRAVREIVADRPLEVTVLSDVMALDVVPDAAWRDTLVALVDVDVPGAMDVLAVEERLGGRLFGVTLLVASGTPVPRASTEDGERRPLPWTAAFTKPIPARELLRVIDREIVFDQYEAR